MTPATPMTVPPSSSSPSKRPRKRARMDHGDRYDAFKAHRLIARFYLLPAANKIPRSDLGLYRRNSRSKRASVSSSKQTSLHHPQ